MAGRSIAAPRRPCPAIIFLSGGHHLISICYRAAVTDGGTRGTGRAADAGSFIRKAAFNDEVARYRMILAS